MRDYELFFMRGPGYSEMSLGIWFKRLLKLAAAFLSTSENGNNKRRLIALGFELQERIHRVAGHCGPFLAGERDFDDGLKDMLASLGVHLPET